MVEKHYNIKPTYKSNVGTYKHLVTSPTSVL